MHNACRILRFTRSLEVLRIKISGGNCWEDPIPWSKFRFQSTLRVLVAHAWMWHPYGIDDLFPQLYDKVYAGFLATCPKLEVLNALDIGFRQEPNRTPLRLRWLKLESSNFTMTELETYIFALLDGSAFTPKYSDGDHLPAPASALMGLLARTGGRLKELALEMNLECFSEKDLGMLNKSCRNLEVLKASMHDLPYMAPRMWPAQLKRIVFLPVYPRQREFPYSWQWLEELPKTIKDLTMFYDHISWSDRMKLPMQAVEMFRKAKVVGMNVSLWELHGPKVRAARNRNLIIDYDTGVVLGSRS